jgi:hypothetical protein
MKMVSTSNEKDKLLMKTNQTKLKLGERGENC